MKPSIQLNPCCTLELQPSSPFNFDATFFKPDHFPSQDTAWEPGIRWQTMRWHGRPLGLKFENRGTLDLPRINLSVWSQDELDQEDLQRLAAEITYRYNLLLDLTGFKRCFEDDEQLGAVLQRWQGMRPMHSGSLYEYLIIAIVLQNATVRRSVSMLQALFERYGTLLDFDGRRLYSFWEPEDICQEPELLLRELKVGYRAKSILRVSQALAVGVIDEADLRKKSLEVQRQALLGLYGIGPASVGYMLFDVFHQLDELSYISPWEQKIYSRLLFGTATDTPVPVEDLLSFFHKRFGGYRMLAVHYLWEDLWWQRRQGRVEWLEKLIRL